MVRATLNRRWVALLALAALALFAAAALAAPAAEAKKIATSVTIIDGGLSEGNLVVLGKVASPKKKCRGNRQVILLAERSGTFKPADRARSSANGGWLLLAKITDDLGALKVKVTRKKLRNGDVCKGAAKPVQLSV